MTTYYVGSEYPIGVTFLNRNGSAADPTAVTLQVEDPAGAITTYTFGVGVQIVKDGTGLYSSFITNSLAGAYKWSFAGTGAVVAAMAGSWTVEATGIA